MPGNRGWGRGRRMKGEVSGARPAEILGTRGTWTPFGGSGYLARLGGGCQARVSPVVAPYGHHAGADFVAQFQGEHRQQHDGGGSGEEGPRPQACAAEPASPAAVQGLGTTVARFQLLQAWAETARDRGNPPHTARSFCGCAGPPSLFCGCAGSAQVLLRLRGRASRWAETEVVYVWWSRVFCGCNFT